MVQQIPVDKSARAHEVERETLHEVAADLAYHRHLMVNVAFFGVVQAGDRNWVLIDAGVIGSAERIADAAEERFGVGARP